MTTGFFHNETTTPLSSGVTFTGNIRDSGILPGKETPYAYYNAFFCADQTGTASIECSVDGITWYPCATSVLAASTPLLLTVPMMARYHRAKLVNGSTNQTSLIVNSSYTGS